MRTKRISALIAVFAVLLCIFPAKRPLISNADTVGEAQSFIDGIIGYKLTETGAGSVQDWINGDLASNAGQTAEFYIIALSQSGGGYDFSSYENALAGYLGSNSVPSATSRQKYALALAACGSTNSYITSALGDSVGEQGIMSWVYGLHLLNNGYTGPFTASQAVDTLLSQQFDDGGWALWGTVGDIDVTAMTIQALAPYYGSDTRVTDAVDRALDMLSSRQLDTGDYSSYGTDNPESTAQVITALASLGIDAMSDPRFIKGDSTLLTGLSRYRRDDGSFSHTVSGDYNHNATMQVFYSLIAYMRQQRGAGAFYVLDRRVLPQQQEEEAPDTPDIPETQPSHGGGDEPSPAPVTTSPADAPQSPAQTSLPNGTQQSSLTVSAYISTSAAQSTTLAALITEPAVLTSLTAASTNVSTTAEISATTAAAEVKESTGSYKPTVIIIILGLAGVTALILLITGKRHPKNFIALIIASGALIAFVQFTSFRTAEEYYSAPAQKDNVTGTVTMTIRCDTVAERADHRYIPESGEILEVTEFDISDGETAYDILTQAARTYSIQLDTRGSGDMVYVAGINYLYEYDFGELSGWMFRVNGETPSVGAGAYALSDGDFIEWLYSTNIGNDL